MPPAPISNRFHADQSLQLPRGKRHKRRGKGRGIISALFESRTSTYWQYAGCLCISIILLPQGPITAALGSQHVSTEQTSEAIPHTPEIKSRESRTWACQQLLPASLPCPFPLWFSGLATRPVPYRFNVCVQLQAPPSLC